MPEAAQAHDAAARGSDSSAGHRSPWRGRLGSRVASLLCLVAAVVLEYFLVNLPIAQEVGGQFHPAIAKAGLQAVTFQKPQDDSGSFAFEYTPASEADPVTVDAYFDNAQLSPETLQSFHSLQVAAPSSAAGIIYATSAVKNGACATKFEVKPVSPPGSVRFSQTEGESLAGFRNLGISILGSDAEVTLTSAGAMQNLLSPCKVDLSVGDWKQRTGGFFPIKIRVPAGANFRFRWQRLQEATNTFDNKGAASSLLQFGSGGDEFSAGAVQIGSLKSEASKPAALEAIADRKTALTIDSFAIDKDNLAITASGTGRVLKNGSVITKTDALEVVNKNPLLSALFGAGNVALLGWVGRSWFPSRKKKK